MTSRTIQPWALCCALVLAGCGTGTAHLRLDEAYTGAWGIPDLRIITEDFRQRCVTEPAWAQIFTRESQRSPVLWIPPPSSADEDVPAEAITAAIAESFSWRGAVQVSPVAQHADFALHTNVAKVLAHKEQGGVEVFLAQFVVWDLAVGRVVCAAQGTNQRMADLS